MSIPLKERILNLPVVPLRGLVSFPGMPINFEAGRKTTIAAINNAMDKDQLIFLVTQKDIRDESPSEEHLYEIGCVARIRQFLKLSEKSVKVIAEGLYRAKRLTITKSTRFSYAAVMPISDKIVHRSEAYTEALLRKIRESFEEYALLTPSGVTTDVMMNVATIDDLDELSNYVSATVFAPFDDKQFVLEQNDQFSRAKVLLKLLAKECHLLKIDNKISESVKVQLDDNQREYYLKEQLKAISDELYGESGDDTDEYYSKVAKLKASEVVKEKLNSEINKLSKMPQGSQESAVVRNYLDECLSLPWDISTPTKNDIKRSKKILDRDFYGMKNVKERI